MSKTILRIVALFLVSALVTSDVNGFARLASASVRPIIFTSQALAEEPIASTERSLIATSQSTELRRATSAEGGFAATAAAPAREPSNEELRKALREDWRSYAQAEGEGFSKEEFDRLKIRLQETHFTSVSDFDLFVLQELLKSPIASQDPVLFQKMLHEAATLAYGGLFHPMLSDEELLRISPTPAEIQQRGDIFEEDPAELQGIMGMGWFSIVYDCGDYVEKTVRHVIGGILPISNNFQRQIADRLIKGISHLREDSWLHVLALERIGPHRLREKKAQGLFYLHIVERYGENSPEAIHARHEYRYHVATANEEFESNENIDSQPFNATYTDREQFGEWFDPIVPVDGVIYEEIARRWLIVEFLKKQGIQWPIKPQSNESERARHSVRTLMERTDLDDAEINAQIGYHILDVESQLRTQVATQYGREYSRYIQSRYHVIREVIAALALGPEDIFYDLGGGYGQVALYAAVETSVKSAKALELVYERMREAERVKMIHHISNVEFITGDVRSADFKDGTAFFLFDPFRQHTLDIVLNQLREIAANHPIRVAAWGPFTTYLQSLQWLHIIHKKEENHVTIFTIFECRQAA